MKSENVEQKFTENPDIEIIWTDNIILILNPQVPFL